jgi:hypothetical protein
MRYAIARMHVVPSTASMMPRTMHAGIAATE